MELANTVELSVSERALESAYGVSVVMFVKYRRHCSLPLESPLARKSIQEETVANGLSGIALCSSRSRSRRDSGSGKHSRRNSHDKEMTSSPKQQRRSGVRDSLGEDGGIVLDPSSILDEIMAKTFSDKESEEEKTPPRGLSNGTTSPVRGTRDKERRTEGEESSRQRSAAMDITSSAGLKSKAKLVSERAGGEMTSLAVPGTQAPSSGEQTEMKSSERKSEIRRSGSINKGDYRKSGGNWGKLRGQITGGKALGMFYHNRHSQHFEDSLEGLERNEALPISPLAETGPQVFSQAPTETEPEVSIHHDVSIQSLCEVKGSVLNRLLSHTMRVHVPDQRMPTLALSPTYPQNSGEPSALQQALQAKKQAQSRVAQRAKKMYAMMEEEVVIGDPTAPRVGQLSPSQLPGGVAETETKAEPTEEAKIEERRPGLEWAYAPTDMPLG